MRLFSELLSERATAWTRERPTKSGIYWIDLGAGEPDLLRVFEHDGGLAYEQFSSTRIYSVDATPDGAKWAGPLQPPAL